MACHFRENFSRFGQVSVEMLLITAVLLGFVALAAAISFVTLNDSVVSNQTLDALRSLKTGINYVYAAGPGNSVVVFVTFPASAVNFNLGGVSGKEISLDVEGFMGLRNYWIETDANLAGSLPAVGGGPYPIRILSAGDRVVLEVMS